jgi:hypothetical protein
MITFNESDFNLPKVKREAKLGNLLTVNNYRVYGLRHGDGNPPIVITYNNYDIENIVSKIENFFVNNGIE